jgi:acyl dehydratase
VADGAAAADSRVIEPGQSFAAPPFWLGMQRLIMCSAASRDFAPAHIISAAARRDGAPDAYADITFVFAMVERLLVGWAGPGVRIRAIGPIEFTGFVLAGQDVVATGEVLEAAPGMVDGLPCTDVTVQVRIAQSDGRVPVTGRARCAVPSHAPARTTTPAADSGSDQ